MGRTAAEKLAAVQPAIDASRAKAAQAVAAFSKSFDDAHQAAEQAKQAALGAQAEKEKREGDDRARRLREVEPVAWNLDDVCNWLASVGLEAVSPGFRANRIDGEGLLSLTTDDYKEVGVTTLGDRKKLQSKLAELVARSRGGAPAPLATTTASAAAVAVDATSEWEIARSEVTLFRELGRGSFGAAYLAYYNDIKVVAKEALGKLDAAKRAEARAEADMMRRVCNPFSPYVLQFYGMVMDDRGILLVTEHCDVGGLHPYLVANPTLAPATRLSFCVHIARGMAHMHRLKPPVLHRDLAARNILLAQRDGQLLAKVSDFGLSRAMPREENHYEIMKSPIPYRWSAPEVLSTSVFYPSSDVWAFGVTAWEIYSNGALPYGKTVSTADVTDGVPRETLVLSRPDQCPDKVWSVIKKSCLVYTAHNRATFAQVFESLHAVFGGISTDEAEWFWCQGPGRVCALYRLGRAFGVVGCTFGLRSLRMMHSFAARSAVGCRCEGARLLSRMVQQVRRKRVFVCVCVCVYCLYALRHACMQRDQTCKGSIGSTGVGRL